MMHKLSHLPSLPQYPAEQTASRSDRGGHTSSPCPQGAWPRGSKSPPQADRCDCHVKIITSMFCSCGLDAPMDVPV